MFGFDKGKKRKAFWKWFEENADQLFQRTQEDPEFEMIIGDVGERLALVDDALGFEIALSAEDGKKVFFISANGDSKKIKSVEKLVAAAPSLTQWKIVAFKQRKIDPVTLKLPHSELNAETVLYMLEPDGDKIAIHLYFKEFEERSLRVFQEVGFIFLDATLGEYDVMTKAGVISFEGAHDAPTTAKSIGTLAKEFDVFKK